MTEALKKDFYVTKTRLALVLMSLLSEPLVALYTWLPFIARKELGATALQISILTALRPVVSLLSFYWSHGIDNRRERLRGNLILSGIFARVPLMLFFFFNNVWYVILASTIYMLFTRAGIPAWMEILKLNVPGGEREKLFSMGTLFAYLEGMVFALSMGMLLDFNGDTWKILFLIASGIGLVGLFFQSRVPIRGEKPAPIEMQISPIVRLVKPWRDTLHLMRTRPDFARFQAAFMAGGFGLMLISTVLPLYFVDVLDLSHTQFTTARSICMAIGFVGSTWAWTRSLSKIQPGKLTSLINFLFALFPLVLILAKLSTGWLYSAYIIYGIAQGGSHMLWHLSGPLFAGEEDSSIYSGVNIVMVGIRGIIAPMIAPMLYLLFGPTTVLILGMLICSTGGLYMLRERSSLTTQSD
ncbi:MAG: MFS transporter [Simkaniaceae bacterium]|nr:MFS transporter [Simkaniaceae bacterium]